MTGDVRVATKGNGGREMRAALRNYAIRNAQAKSKPRRHVPDRGRIETLCVSTPDEDEPRN